MIRLQSINFFVVLVLGAFMTYVHAESIQWRGGIGVAFEYLNAEAKEKDDFSALGVVNLADRKQTQKELQVAPSFEVGFTYCDDYYLGVLTSWRYSNAHTKSRAPLALNSYFVHEFKLNSYTNILAKLGYKLMPKTMIYGLLGPSIARWSHKTDQYVVSVASTLPNQINSFKLSKTTIGLAFGFGLEQCLNENFALSIDYVHGFLKDKVKSQRLTVGVPSFSATGVTTRFRSGVVSKKVRPSYDSIAARLSYFF